MSMTALVKGFGTGAGLIMAIGAQNAFVLSSGLRNQHVVAVALACIVIDVLLILAGVMGLGGLIQRSPGLLNLATWGGALFLFVYGLLAFRRALTPQTLQATQVEPMSRWAAVSTIVVLSLLNPHVYLDTVVLLGSIGGQLPGSEPRWFALGACLASAIWFFGLAFGGRLLAPWFARPRSWQLLDSLVGVIMWLIAFSLIMSAVR